MTGAPNLANFKFRRWWQGPYRSWPSQWGAFWKSDISHKKGLPDRQFIEQQCQWAAILKVSHWVFLKWLKMPQRITSPRIHWFMFFFLFSSIIIELNRTYRIMSGFSLVFWKQEMSTKGSIILFSERRMLNGAKIVIKNNRWVWNNFPNHLFVTKHKAAFSLI